jgi:O-antigen/teichoic acid export membrane protein
VGIFVARDFFQWVAGSEFDDVALMCAWLAFLPLFHGLAELPPMGLLGLGRNRERMLMGFATSIVAIASYLALVPSLGWRGAVLGTYMSETAAIVAGWVLLRRYQRIADT